MASCENCGKPAGYIGRHGELVCADCAGRWHVFTQGERYGTAHAVCHAVDRMRSAEYTVDEIREAFEYTVRTGQPFEQRLAREDGRDGWGLDKLVPLNAIEGGESNAAQEPHKPALPARAPVRDRKVRAQGLRREKG